MSVSWRRRLLNDKAEVTSESIFLQRRQVLKGLAAIHLLPGAAWSAQDSLAGRSKFDFNQEITDEVLTSGYNNYYEFSTNKKMVRHISKEFDTSGWKLLIDGLVEQPLTLTVPDIQSLERVNRIYSLRCVEGWSAVIPWTGCELNQILRLAKPQPAAKYVKFTGHYDPSSMIGQRENKLPWPYTEGLRLDEAMHPLTLMATGMYDKPLFNQNGAPLRLVVPWKYGYKSIKAITRISLTDTQPLSSWQKQVPSEYGFYANVNPNVPHPRWSQRREVRLGEVKKRRTKLLNGYAEELKELYQNDNLNQLI